jgi:hypothetical protein
VGCSIEDSALRQMGSLMEPGILDAARVARLNSELDALPAPRDAVEDLRCERLSFLQAHTRFLAKACGWRNSLAPPGPGEVAPSGFDFDQVLRRANADFDRLEGALAEGSPRSGPRAYNDAANEIQRQGMAGAERHKQLGWWLTVPFRSSRSIRAERSETMADLLVGIVGQGTARYWAKRSIVESRLQLLRIALRLVLRRIERGAYPDDLDGIVPDGLRETLVDLFSGKPLIYRRGRTGFVLYSVGENGRDDGGDPGRDLVVQVNE